jgi:hypothetical protein
MLPQSLEAKAATSTEPDMSDQVAKLVRQLNGIPPYVSAYICANEFKVKHHPMSVEAKATLPFSGLSLKSESGLIPLEKTRQ